MYNKHKNLGYHVKRVGKELLVLIRNRFVWVDI